MDFETEIYVRSDLLENSNVNIKFEVVQAPVVIIQLEVVDEPETIEVPVLIHAPKMIEEAETIAESEMIVESDGTVEVSEELMESSDGEDDIHYSNYSALDYMIETGDYLKFRNILETTGYPRFERSGYLLLCKALQLGQICIAEYLIDREDCPVKRDRYCLEATPLHYAASLANKGLVKKLLAQGASVEDCNEEYQTPVHSAFYSLNAKVMNLLMKAYLKINYANIVDIAGLSYLHIASCSHNPKVLKRLLQGGADVDCQIDANHSEYAGYTALHMAVDCHQLEAVGILLSFGANLYVRDNSGSTPLHLALLRKDCDIINLIFRFEEAWDNPINSMGMTHFHAACANGDDNIVRMFMAKNVENMFSYMRDTTYANGIYPGYTALHFAAEFGQSRVCSQLMAYNVKTLERTANGYTAAEIATRNRYLHAADAINNYYADMRGAVYAKEVEHNRFNELTSLNLPCFCERCLSHRNNNDTASCCSRISAFYDA